jgi:hypothetical protein
VHRLAYNGDVAAGQLAVFQGASEAPISGSIRADPPRRRRNSQPAAARAFSSVCPILSPKKGDKLSATFAVPNHLIMSVARPAEEDSREIVMPDYLQLLLGGLLLALSLCIPIIVLTMHVKRMITNFVPPPYFQASPAETPAPLNIPRPGTLELAPSIVRAQTARVSLSVTPGQTASLAPNRSAGPDERGGDEFASQETGMSKRILRHPNPTPALRGIGASPSLSGTRFRTNSPRRVKSALIAIWHGIFNQPQKQ